MTDNGYGFKWQMFTFSRSLLTTDKRPESVTEDTKHLYLFIQTLEKGLISTKNRKSQIRGVYDKDTCAKEKKIPHEQVFERRTEGPSNQTTHQPTNERASGKQTNE